MIQPDPSWSIVDSTKLSCFGGECKRKFFFSYLLADEWEAANWPTGLTREEKVQRRWEHFNKYKSNLKILEAANIGCPVVVSRVHPYLDFPEDLVNYVDSQRDWYGHVKMLLDNPEFAEEQGKKLKDYCQRVYNFEAINQKRKDLIYDVAGGKGKTTETPTENNAMAVGQVAEP